VASDMIAELGQVAQYDHALACYQRGRLDEAAQCLRDLLHSAADHHLGWYLSGLVAAKLGQAEAAIAMVQRAVVLNGAIAEFQSTLAAMLQAQQRSVEALAAYDRLIALQPNDVGAYVNRGNALGNLGRHAEAVASYDQAISLEPGQATAHNNRANTLRDLGRFADSVESCDRAIALRPDFAMAHLNRGNALGGLRRYAEAIACYDRAIVLSPDYAMAHNNRANVLRDAHRHAEALAGYDRAIALEPDNADGYINRGNALGDLARYDEALEHYARALELRPQFHDTKFNMAIIHLQLGRFEIGWRMYEARKIRTDPIGNRTFPQPAWTGAEPIAGKTLFIHCEQGLGDIIQFYRYTRIMVERGAVVILSVKEPLRRLFAAAHPAIELVEEAATPAAFDYHCALLSLPLALGTALDTIPAAIPYLWTEWRLRQDWSARLPPRGKPRLGFVWSGSPTYKNDHNRSIDLAVLTPLFDIDADWICLHKDVTPRERAMLSEYQRVTFLGDGIADFADTAAIIDQLDLVITVDTSVAHLAGAMGKPVWILLPHNADWRWMILREDTPWYPTARLFRQQLMGDWPGVVARIKDALRHALRVV
jgi:tetratricopeptide (TPR) repeat protein